MVITKSFKSATPKVVQISIRMIQGRERLKSHLGGGGGGGGGNGGGGLENKIK